MRLGVFGVLVFVSACGSTTAHAPPSGVDAAVDGNVPGVDASVDVSGSPARTALSAFASPTTCYWLRATSSGFHTLCYSTGKPTNDFAGAPIAAGPEGVHTLLAAAPDGKTKWAVPTCNFKDNWGDLDGLPTGEAVLVGSTESSCTIGSKTVISGGKSDGIIARFDAAGALQWMQRMGNAGDDRALHVRLDELGNAIVTGSTGVPDATSLPIATAAGTYVAKVSPSGDVVWTKTFAKSYGDRIGVGPDNAVYIFANVSDSEDFGAGPIPVGPAESVLAVVKFAADGAFVWQQVIRMPPTAGATAGFSPTALDVVGDTAGGAWFLIGYAGLGVEFGSVKLTSPGTQTAVAIGHLDSAGAALGGQVFENPFNPRWGHLAAGPAGTAFFATSYGGLPSYAFVGSFRVDGKATWTAPFEGATSEGLAFDGSSIMLLGHFRGELSLGVKTLTATGPYDSFVARFAP